MGNYTSESSGPSPPSNSEPRGINNQAGNIKVSKKRRHSPDPVPSKSKKRRTNQRKPSSNAYDSEASPDSDISPPAPTPTPAQSSHAHFRTRHNIVEQQYRHRLNLQFKNLLEILPDKSVHDHPGSHPPGPSHSGSMLNSILLKQDEPHSPHSPPNLQSLTLAPLLLPPSPDSPNGPNSNISFGHNRNYTPTQNTNGTTIQVSLGKGPSNGGEQRRVSKAEVLDRARVYIEALEREHRRLVAERRELDLLWVEHCRRDNVGGVGGVGVLPGGGPGGGPVGGSGEAVRLHGHGHGHYQQQQHQGHYQGHQAHVGQGREKD